MTENDPRPTPPTLPLPPRTRPFPKGLRAVLATLLLILLGVVATLGWLIGSESGFRALCDGLQRLSGGELVLEQPAGRLLDKWSLGRLHWRDASQAVTIEQLAIDWIPADLLQQRLNIARLEAASLSFASAPSDTPAVLPDQLALPIAVNIAELKLGRIVQGDFVSPDNPTALLAEYISARLVSDGQEHRVEQLQATLGLLSLQADATLDGTSPFALKLQTVLQGAALGQAFALDLQGTGSLESLQINGLATSKIVQKESAGTVETPAGEAITGTLQATITPFASRPLAALQARLKGIDPAVFVEGAPAALLDVDAVFDAEASAAKVNGTTTSGPDALAGRVSINNRRSGSIDRQLLPVRSLQSTLDWAGERLVLSGLNVILDGGGKLVGTGTFVDGQLDLDLMVSGIDAQALYGNLLPTRLAGPLTASVGEKTQTLAIDLRDKQYAIKGRASLGDDAIELTGLEVGYEKARLQAEGRLALGGDGRFSARGQLQDFEPARFLKDQAAALGGLPGTRLSASFDAQGALQPQTQQGAALPSPQLALRFDLKDSRINGQKMAGQGEIDLLGGRVRKAAVDLDVAGNRLISSGAFGQAGDRLRVQIQAPKLEALGLSNIYGDAQADFTLGGSVAQPDFSGELSVKRLKIASLLDLRNASLNAQLGAGADAALVGTLRCAACAFPSAGLSALTIEMQADGVRNRHHLTTRIDLPENRQLRMALDGGLQESAPGKAGTGSALGWRGTLSEFWLGQTTQAGKAASASALPLFALKTASPLQLGGATLSFGPAVFSGSFGDLRLDRLSLDAGHWQSTGRWQGIRPSAVLAEFPALSDWRELLGPQSLSLAGEWDVALDKQAQAVGRAAVWREAGDLSFASLSLGLAEPGQAATRLQATLSAGQLSASLEVHGARLGDISAQVETRPGASFDPNTPLQGRLQARMPDLAWLQPLLGEAWQVAGQIDGQMNFSGTVAKPQFAGTWRGEKLAVRALDQGMRLERGEALIEVTPDKLLLRRLAFDSELQPLPRILQLDTTIDAAQLTGKPGRFEASGELALGGGNGTAGTAKLRLRLDRVGVMQRPDQWVAVSGDGELRLGESELVASGKLAVDAGLWRLADAGRPSLSDDVVIRRANEKRTSPVRRAIRLDLQAALGRSFHFRGAGVESRLAGDVRIRSDDAGLPRASGTIRTTEGRFDAYGQKLDIQRGIINFQGAIDNPGLNILAVRPNLQIEAGVEVTGTAQRPVIRLVSTPNVPDTEKLSWLVLGRAPDQQGNDDSSLLFAAAQTIFGGQDGGFLGQLQQGLGIDEFGVSSGQVGGNSRQATSQVATTGGFGQSQTVSGQVVSIGKRLSSNALLSYEQSLSTTESIVKLTVDLSRQFSVVGRAGTDSAVDFFWHYRFGK